MTEAGRSATGAESQDEPEARRGEAELLLRAILDHLPITVARYDREGVFTFQDGKGLELIGVKSGEFIGKNVLEIYGDHQEGVDDLRRGLAGEASQSVHEALGIVFETWFIPVRDGRGEPDGLVCVTLDASASRQREIELQNKLDMIERQQKASRTSSI
ncbi:hypothetical protein BE08_35390 [Sorangium cellulosum]|uniref:PAS domain-containing protein n=1 Tax=Sorangium cellulosum TaxID=56 RepID=A0A150PV28_SORCE|nr:hypothetical protein BE08_35390 [Sorangium cellulosum]